MRNNAERAYFIAEHFHVSEDKVIAFKYSFILVQEPDKSTTKGAD